MAPTIKVVKAAGGSYKLEFKYDDGSIVGKVTLRLAVDDTRADHEKRQAAVAKLREMTDAFCDAVENLRA
jgi:hypothetical protein